ncbi:MAG: F0F1 ATP synthase subunit delta [Chloroflexota bacterium]|nr:F0F1 ATP synthase subunit delta [Chloroflexota bacterium]
MASSAATRYAQAVFSLGKERGTLDVWQSDLTDLATLTGDSRVSSYLSNPSITADTKLATLEASLPSTVQPELRNLAKLLVVRDRTNLIPQIREIFEDQVRAERGITVAQVTTSEPLTAEEEALVREKLAAMTGNTIEITATVDPDIIGGIVVRIGDQVIDGSVRNKLERMRTRLVAGR